MFDSIFDVLMFLVRVGVIGGIFYYLYKMGILKEILRFIGLLKDTMFMGYGSSQDSSGTVSNEELKNAEDIVRSEDKKIEEDIKESKERLEKEVREELDKIKSNVSSKKDKNYRDRASNLKIRWKNKENRKE